MIGGLVEVAAERRHLHKFRGFLQAREGEQEIGRVALDKIESLVVSAQSATVSKALLVALADQGSVTVLTDARYNPAALVLPVRQAAESIGHPEDQVAASQSQKKRLWQAIVQRKIAHQAFAVQICGQRPEDSEPLAAMVSRVKSGDSSNVEAAAARRYFLAMFGPDFVRSEETQPLNAYLNYGYMVVRAQCARALCAVGLSPAFGLYHRSRRNPFRLADDIIEPFRPFVDMRVKELTDAGEIVTPLSPSAKQDLVKVLQLDVDAGGRISPLSAAITAMAISLAKCFRHKTLDLMIPCPLGEAKRSSEVHDPSQLCLRV